MLDTTDVFVAQTCCIHIQLDEGIALGSALPKFIFRARTVHQWTPSPAIPRTREPHFILSPSEASYATNDPQRVFATLPLDRKSTRLNSSHSGESRMPSSA